MRLLVIEDEEKTSTYLCRALTESGFTVDSSADGSEGLYYALEFDYDAIILDVMLPGIDGYRWLSMVIDGYRWLSGIRALACVQANTGSDAFGTRLGR